MGNFFDLSYNELVLLSAIIANEISNQLTTNQKNIFGNFLEAIGQNMLVATAIGISYPPQGRGPNFGVPGVGEFGSIYRYGFTVYEPSEDSKSSETASKAEIERNMKNMMESIEKMQKEINELQKCIRNNIKK